MNVGRNEQHRRALHLVAVVSAFALLMAPVIPVWFSTAPDTHVLVPLPKALAVTRFQFCPAGSHRAQLRTHPRDSSAGTTAGRELPARRSLGWRVSTAIKELQVLSQRKVRWPFCTA